MYTACLRASRVRFSHNAVARTVGILNRPFEMRKSEERRLCESRKTRVTCRCIDARRIPQRRYLVWYIKNEVFVLGIRGTDDIDGGSLKARALIVGNHGVSEETTGIRDITRMVRSSFTAWANQSLSVTMHDGDFNCLRGHSHRR